jgi:hypothetical protein
MINHHIPERCKTCSYHRTWYWPSKLEHRHCYHQDSYRCIERPGNSTSIKDHYSPRWRWLLWWGLTFQWNKLDKKEII